MVIVTATLELAKEMAESTVVAINLHFNTIQYTFKISIKPL